MRWPVKFKTDTRPQTGALRYRIKFAWIPITTTGVTGSSISWNSEIIWLEKVMEVQEYYRCSVHNRRSGNWYHHVWYPINEFTIALWEHNNQ